MLLNISDQDVYNALAGFLGKIVPKGTTIQRGQQNRVSMPTGPCVIVTTMGALGRVGTNEDATVTDAGSSDGGFVAAVTADFEYSVQADFYSPDAESWAMAVELLWRDKLGWYAMPFGMKPLYSEGRRQLPLVGGEKQWIQRWVLTLVLDYQPTVATPTQAATSATVVPEPVDVFYPP